MKKKQPSGEARPEVEMPHWLEMRHKVNEPAPLKKQWSVEEKESILDYLHGDVADDEVKAICYYEYARASETLRKARQAFDPADPENSSLKVSSYLPGWTCGWFCFWQCPGYPVLPWLELSPEQQEKFVMDFRKSPHPHVIRDVLMLKGGGVLHALAQLARDELNEFNQRARNPHDFVFARGFRPAIVNDPVPFIKHVVITVDYRDGIEAVMKQFARWLHSEANQKLFDDYDYHNSPIDKRNPGSPTRYKELLKFLAAWRLYDELARCLRCHSEIMRVEGSRPDSALC